MKLVASKKYGKEGINKVANYRRSIVLIGVSVVLVLIMYVGIMISPQWGRLGYLWFEIPAVKNEISRIPGVSFIDAQDVGPKDEVKFEVKLMIDGKGELVLASPKAVDLRDNKAVYVVAIDGCIIPSTLPNGIRIMPLSRAINEFDRIYSAVKSETNLSCH